MYLMEGNNFNADSLLKSAVAGLYTASNLDLLCIRRSYDTYLCENYAELSFDAEHLEKGLNREWWNFWCPFFFKKVLVLVNIGHFPNFLWNHFDLLLRVPPLQSYFCHDLACINVNCINFCILRKNSVQGIQNFFFWILRFQNLLIFESLPTLNEIWPHDCVSYGKYCHNMVFVQFWKLETNSRLFRILVKWQYN